MEKTIRNKIFSGLTYLAVAGVSVSLGKGFLENAEWERTRREVQFAIDRDENKIITKQEWVPVYLEIGSGNSANYGVDLTTSQLEQYLENHKGDKR